MRRALETVTPETRAAADATLLALIEGVELTERELLKALEKNGVKRIEPLGEKFDPNFHQAMYEIPDASVPAGNVIQVVQAGYKIGERVLRPALVAVAKGGPKETPASEPANDNAGFATGN
jgi:molecular chaperone GrpE